MGYSKVKFEADIKEAKKPISELQYIAEVLKAVREGRALKCL